MCRFIGYLGHEIGLDDVLFKPKNSLIKQSIHASESSHPLNGDGFGLGWYTNNTGQQPALFTSTQPAWNDRNLGYIAPKIKSHCLFAHVRAASHGQITQYNCHPFHYQQFLFMHNGTIYDFNSIKRDLLNELSPDIFNWVQGQTDSEHMAALFINEMQKNNVTDDVTQLGHCLVTTLEKIKFFKNKVNCNAPSYINFAITNGYSLVTARYISDLTLTSNTLYYSTGERYQCRDGQCHMIPNNKRRHAAIIASEKLTHFNAEWHEIPVNHLLTIDPHFNITENKINP